MPRTIYCVVENMPGYLPEGDPAFFLDRADARAYAKDCEDALAEEDDDRYIVDMIEVDFDPTNPDHADLV